ncbi:MULTISPECIES: LysR family transcriptional regulator [unclassified Streptomyces]|uniref:LysR family transcriptional regulator n=1 Tax=unclassified Streptomyces TaxID=2593676 RepID=UPI00382450B9
MSDSTPSRGRRTPLPSAVAPVLAQFVAVGRREHLTRAAEELGISQPTLSRAMNRLEAQLGVPLFRHTGRRIRLTAHGRHLLARAEQALEVLELAGQEVAAEADPEYGQVSLAHLKSLGTRTVPALLRAFHSAHPHIRFRLTEAPSDRMIELLRAGEVDLCLIAPLPEDPEIDAVPLLQEEIRLVVAPGHRWATRKSVRLPDAAAEPFVALRQGYGSRQIADALCRAAGFTPRIGIEADALGTARGLVAAGLGVALLPYEGSPHSGTVEIPLAQSPDQVLGASRTLALAWPAHAVQPAAVSLFRGFLTARRGRLAEIVGPATADSATEYRG